MVAFKTRFSFIFLLFFPFYVLFFSDVLFIPTSWCSASEDYFDAIDEGLETHVRGLLV